MRSDKHFAVRKDIFFKVLKISNGHKTFICRSVPAKIVLKHNIIPELFDRCFLDFFGKVMVRIRLEIVNSIITIDLAFSRDVVAKMCSTPGT